MNDEKNAASWKAAAGTEIAVLKSITTDTPLRQAALIYAQAGWPVFPLVPKTKSPLKGSHGFLDATTSTAIVSQWWQNNPNYNIGIATGERAGITVVDVDGPEAQPGDLPETVTVTSGREGGGYHYWYEYEPGTNSVPGIRHKVDRKSAGGFVVAPPSVHQSGKRYHFTKIVPLAPLPVWAGESKTWQEPDEEQGHASIFEAARKLFTAKVPYAIAVRAMLAYNATWEKPEDEAEVRRQTRDVYRTNAKRKIRIVSAETERTRTDIEPRRWFVDEHITTGVTLLTARKGVGKSLFALQMSYAIASGERFLGFQTSKAKVLYFLTELDETDMYERLNSFGPCPENLFISYGKTDDADEDEPSMTIPEAEQLIVTQGIEVLIVDMFTAFLPVEADVNGYGMTPFFLAWRRMAKRHHVALVEVWHSTKATKDDPMSSAIGTTGLAGQADCFLSLERKRTEQTVTLFSGGNHGREFTTQLWLNPELLRFELADGSGKDDVCRPGDKDVLNWIIGHPEGSTTTDIAANLLKSDGSIRASCSRLRESRLIEKKGRSWVPKDENEF